MIPWKSFAKAKKTPPALGDTWRMNFYAMQDNGGVSWSPILGQGNFHRASRFGKILWAEKGWMPQGPSPIPAMSVPPSVSSARPPGQITAQPMDPRKLPKLRLPSGTAAPKPSQ